MGKEIFRKAALERLSSPDRLDSLMQVTTTNGWIALIAILVVIVGGLVWGVFSRLPDNVDGAGILLRQGGVFDIEATGAGVIDTIYVQLHDQVDTTMIVARIAQPELDRAIEQTEARLEDLRRNHSRVAVLINRNEQLEFLSLEEQIRQVVERARAARAQVAYLEERVKALDSARTLGLITPDVFQNAVHELALANDGLVGAEAEKTQLEARKLTVENQATRQVFTLEEEIRSTERQLELQRLRRDQFANVRSHYNGQVIELLADEGQVVQAGVPLMNVELTEQPLIAAVFVPIAGTQIRDSTRRAADGLPPLKVQVAPIGVNWEEHGYIVGYVRSVSRNPVSAAGMRRILHNEVLIRQFTARGGAYLVDVVLRQAPVSDPADSASASALLWTTGRAPPIDVVSGTLLTAKITVDEHSPISLMIPALRRWLGG